jgi:hypothetical protein
VADDAGWTLLGDAARRGELMTVRWLVEKGADMLALQPVDQLPRQVADAAGHWAVAEELKLKAIAQWAQGGARAPPFQSLLFMVKPVGAQRRCAGVFPHCLFRLTGCIFAEDRVFTSTPHFPRHEYVRFSLSLKPVRGFATQTFCMEPARGPRAPSRRRRARRACGCETHVASWFESSSLFLSPFAANDLPAGTCASGTAWTTRR